MNLGLMKTMILYVGFYLFFEDFIYLFDRERQREREHKQGEWEREKQASR